MKIELDQADITTALTNYIGDLGLNTEGKVVTLNLIAGRGDNGNRVEVFITLPEDTSQEVAGKPKTTRTRKPKVETKNDVVDAKEAHFKVEANTEVAEFESDTDVEFDPDAATTAALNKAAAEIAADEDASLFD